MRKTAALFGIVLAGALVHYATADEWNQEIVFTFSQPVEIPGQVLPAGTYIFKVANSASDRDIVQVFNKRESHIYGTFLTIPDYRTKPTGKVIITFGERAANAPEAVKAWFYPGFEYGHEFVYPKTEAIALAKASHEPVPSMPDALAAETKKPAKTMDEPSVTALKQAQLKAEKPTGEEVGVGEVFQAPPASGTTSSSSQSSR